MNTGVLLPDNAVQIIRGTSKTLVLSVRDHCEKPVNLTGATIQMTVKERAEETRVIFLKNSVHSSQAEITNPTGGIAQIYLQPADTQNLPAKPFVFDVWVVLGSGARYAVVPPSVFEVIAGVTVLP